MEVGLNLGHDSGIARIVSNKIYNIEFEREIGIKNVCGGNNNSFSTYEKKIKEIECTSIGICDFFAGKCGWLPKEMYSVSLDSQKPIQKIYLSKDEQERLFIKENIDVYAIKHHFAHAASTFFTSPFEKSLIMTIDGSSNEAESFVVSRGNKNEIQILESYNNIIGPRFGAFYEKFSKKIFGDKFSAGKLMGLSAYGSEITEIKDLLRLMLIPNYFREKVFKKKIDTCKEVILKINSLNYKFLPDIGHHFDLRNVDLKTAESSIFNDVFEEIQIDGKIFKFEYNYKLKNTQDLAFTIQKVFQEELINIVNYFSQKFSYTNLCFAGGSFLNILSNSEIFSKYEKIHIPPFCNDSGISIGCALVLKHIVNKQKRIEYLNLPYGGDFFNEKEHLKNLSFSKLNEKEFYNLAIQKINQGKVIGWINSRYELGPRALGNRSILASPLISGMKDFINSEVKFRESFRPLAPIIIEEELNNYFYNGPSKSPYMLYNYNVKSQYQVLLKEILHVDNTARVQTVNEKENSIIYKLLLELKKYSKIPILFNTSLNVKGKPILNNYEEVYHMLKDTKLDSIFFVDKLTYITLKRGNYNE